MVTMLKVMPKRQATTTTVADFSAEAAGTFETIRRLTIAALGDLPQGDGDERQSQLAKLVEAYPRGATGLGNALVNAVRRHEEDLQRALDWARVELEAATTGVLRVGLLSDDMFAPASCPDHGQWPALDCAKTPAAIVRIVDHYVPPGDRYRGCLVILGPGFDRRFRMPAAYRLDAAAEHTARFAEIWARHEQRKADEKRREEQIREYRSKHTELARESNPLNLLGRLRALESQLGVQPLNLAEPEKPQLRPNQVPLGKPVCTPA